MPRQVKPETTPKGVQPELKIIPKMLQPFCPKGTKWNEQYKKCLPVLQ